MRALELLSSPSSELKPPAEDPVLFVSNVSALHEANSRIKGRYFIETILTGNTVSLKSLIWI